MKFAKNTAFLVILKVIAKLSVLRVRKVISELKKLNQIKFSNLRIFLKSNSKVSPVELFDTNLGSNLAKKFKIFSGVQNIAGFFLEIHFF